MRSIEELAEQSGLDDVLHTTGHMESAERFAALVRAQALEEAAGIAAENDHRPTSEDDAHATQDNIVAAIRAAQGERRTP